MTNDLEIRDEADGATHTLTLAGELDMASAPMLADAVVKVCTDGAEELILDIRSLRFIDTTGLRALLASRTCCQEHECAFRMTQGTKQVERLFELAGVAEHLDGWRVELDGDGPRESADGHAQPPGGFDDGSDPGAGPVAAATDSAH